MMKEIEKIDKNFIVKTDITEPDMEWFVSRARNGMRLL